MNGNFADKDCPSVTTISLGRLHIWLLTRIQSLFVEYDEIVVVDEDSLDKNCPSMIYQFSS